MPLRTIDLTLDIDHKQYYYPAIELVQGDNLSLQINVTVLQAGKPIDLTGYTVSFFANFPGTKEFVSDSQNVVTSATGLKAGQFSYIFPMQASQVPGNYTAARFNIISADGVEISKMSRFQYFVEADAAEGAVEAETWVSDFAALLDAIQKMEQQYDESVAEINQAILSAQNVQSGLESKMQTLREEIAQSGYLSKTGDTMNGELVLAAPTGASLAYGSLRHYCGVQAAGTVIGVYFARVWGEWGEYLEVKVGGGSVTSSDGLFWLDAMTPSTTYITGGAPAGYVASKSVINGVEKTANQTIQTQTVFAVVRKGKTVEFTGNPLAISTDTTINGTLKSWGIQATGFMKINEHAVLSDEIVKAPDLNSALDFGKDYYIDANAANAPTTLSTDTQGSLFALRRSATSVLQFYTQYTGRMFIRYMLNNAPFLHTGADEKGWVELASSAQALLDAKTYADANFEKKTGTEWTAPVLNAGFSVLSTAYPPLYRKKGSRIQCKGVVGRTSQKGVMFTLPKGCWPTERRAVILPQVTTAGGAGATVYIQTNGDVELVAAFNDTGVWIEFELDIE